MHAAQTALAPQPERPIGALRPGPVWSSFEQFRMAGPSGPDSVGDGQVGTLRTKTGVFRLLRDRDFQHLAGLASDARRLQSGVGLMAQAANVVRENPGSPSAIALLLLLAAEYTTVNHDRLETGIDATPLDEDDEVITDPAELSRRVKGR